MPPRDSMDKGKEYDNMIGCSQSAPHVVGATIWPSPHCLLIVVHLMYALLLYELQVYIA